MHEIILKTNRIIFTVWRTENMKDAFELYGDIEVTRYIDARVELSDDLITSRVDNEIKIYSNHGVQYFPMYNIENGNFIGCCGLKPYNLKEGIYELGFHIVRKEWGKGYATESAKAMIQYARDVMNAKALFAGHNPKNTASKILLNKLGFKYSHDEHYEATGLMHHSYFLELWSL